jgi:WD40 repeat protein
MAGGVKRGIGTLVPLLHILLGCLLLAIGSTLRLPGGGFVFLVFGAWLAVVGFGIAFGRTSAWWSGMLFHPLLLLGEAAALFVSFFTIGPAWRSEGLGKLGAVVLAFAFGVALAMAFLSIAAWLWLRRPDVREIYFRSDPKVPGSPPRPALTGFMPAVAGIVVLAAALFAYRGYGQPPRPPAERSAPGRVAQEAVNVERCAPRIGSLMFTGAQFSPDGSRLMARAGDGTVCVWDVATGGLRLTLDAGMPASQAWVRPEDVLAISPDGRFLAATGRARDGRGEIGLWDLDTARRTSTIATGSKAMVLLIGFGETAASLIAMTDRHEVSVFDTAALTVRATWSAAPEESIRPVALSSSRRSLAFGINGRGPVRVMDLATGQASSLDVAPVPATGPAVNSGLAAESRTRIDSLLFSRDDRTLYLGRFRAVSALDLVTRVEKPLLALPSDARSGDLTPRSVSSDGTRLLTEMRGFLFPVFDLVTAGLVTQGAPRVSLTKTEVPLFLEGKLWSFGRWGRVVSGGRVAYVNLMPRDNMRIAGEARETSSNVSANATSPDGSLLVLKFDELTNLTLWDARTDAWVDLLSSTVPYSATIRHITFSPDGHTLAVTGEGIDIWDVPKRKLRYRLSGS